MIMVSLKRLAIFCVFSWGFLEMPKVAIAQTTLDSRKEDVADSPVSCEDFAPITNTIRPRDSQKAEPEQANSSCAEDLELSFTPELLAQETTTPEPATEENPEAEPVEPVKVEDPNAWRVYIQPYATIPITTYGSVTVRGREINYHLGLGPLLEVLRVAVSGRIEAWKGNYGLIFDGYYVSLGGSGIKESSRRPNINATLESSLTFDQGIYDFALSYHIGDRPIPYLPNKPTPENSPDEPTKERFPRFWFQPIAGARLNDIGSTIETTLTLNNLNRSRQDTVSAGRTWFEPMLGGKIGLQVSEPVTLWARGDASGFGLAGDEDLSWNAIFGADWWIHRQVALGFAYRFYSITYGNGSGNQSFDFEQNFNGPYLSATFSF